jgi:hypothetical protein
MDFAFAEFGSFSGAFREFLTGLMTLGDVSARKKRPPHCCGGLLDCLA